MAKKFGPTIKKLQRAINGRSDEKLLINKTQIYHQDTDTMVELIYVKKAVWDTEKQKSKYVELFHSSSDVQIVLFLRDYWYTLNGWEIPTDNEDWNKTKKAYEEKSNGLENK